tara:strand:+ start:349 stop:2628 length:2280 start_codon:yes stop_codon:yes gene_type:complete
MKLLDIDGLTYDTAPKEYVTQLTQEYETTHEIEPTERYHWLARLREGAGVTVVTGPAGAKFWRLASPEVHIEIVPDDYELKDRTRDCWSWAAGLTGVTPLAASKWWATPPKESHKAYPQFLAMMEQVASLQAWEPTAALVVNTHDFRILKEETALDWVASLRGTPDAPVCIDGEWDRATRAVSGIALSVQDDNVYIPVESADYTAPVGFGDRLCQAVSTLMRRTPTLFHNAKADIQALYVGDPLDLVGMPVNDTLVLAYLLGEERLGLKPLTKRYLNRNPVEYPGEIRLLPLPLATRYATADTRNTLDLWPLLVDRVKDREQWAIYETLERPLVPLIATMEQEGMPVDAATLLRLRDDTAHTVAALQQMVWQREGLDLASDVDTTELFRRRLGYRPGKLKKEVISKLSFEPWVDTVLGYRKLRHRLRSFLDPYIERWERAGQPDTFRAYADFNQAGSLSDDTDSGYVAAPRTGRLSSSGRRTWNAETERWMKDGLNLQNQDREIRELFTAPEGYVFGSFDYAGLEMRIAADRAQDSVMLDVLTTQCSEAETDPDHKCSACDLHTRLQETVTLLYPNVPIDRPAAKQGNFAGQYGGGADMLVTIMAMQRVPLSEEQAQGIMEARKTLYTGYEQFVVQTIKGAQRNGYTETTEGRRRYEPGILSPDWKTRSHAERALANHTIQGTAADILKRAMLRLVPALKAYDARLIAQVHDEIIFLVPSGNANGFCVVAKQAMESVALPNGLPLIVEGGVGQTWAAVH